MLIGAARRRLKQAVTLRLRDHGLTSLQFWAVVNIDELGAPSLVELAGRLRLDAPAMSRTVTGLLERRLVRAEGDRADRRRVRLSLTPAARKLLPALRVLAAELRGATVHGLTATEEEMLRALLRKVISSLDTMVTP